MFPKRYGFYPYIFLFYLFMPVSYIIRETGWKELIGYGLMLLFLVTYRQLYWPTNYFFTWLMVQLSIILILSVFYSPFIIYMGFFTANFIGWFKEKKEFYRAFALFAAVIGVGVGGILLSFVINNYTRNDLLTLLFNLPFLLVMLLSPIGIRSMNKRTDLEKKLDEANEKIKVLGKREERLRIARDLHDTLGHTLSLITLQSQVVQKLIHKDPERALSSAIEIEKTSRAALRQVRELVSDMRTTSIEEQLTEIERILSAANIEIVVKGLSDFSTIPILHQNIISMCMREAATNIVKHSNASNCLITFELSESNFLVKVADNGIGLSQDTIWGNGITGIKERLTLIEGCLTIHSEQHTVISMKVPVMSKEKKEEMVL